MNELVSIIMPSYNTAPYISSAIESVIRQTYTEWELIIVDDCSTDNTDAVVGKYLSDNRIKYLKNEKNGGAAVSRNRALREAKGKWIAFLDSDDLWNPCKLERQTAFMRENNYLFSYTKYSEMNMNGDDTGATVSGPRRITKTGMFNFCWVGCLTVMYDREKIGLIQVADIRKNNDYAIWLKASRKSDCYLFDEVLAKYRRGRHNSISTQSLRTLIYWHYKMFREAEQQSCFIAILNTARNIGFGFLKKIVYVNHTIVRK